MSKEKKLITKEELNSKKATGDLLPYNPLLENPVISPDKETEQKIELINETESLVELTETKLKAEQRKANLEIELKKIGETKKLTEVINSLIDLGLSKEVITKVASSLKDAKDLKMYSEAIKNFAETRNKNIDNIKDEFGGRKRMKIIAQFQSPSGDKTSVGVDLGGDN